MRIKEIVARIKALEKKVYGYSPEFQATDTLVKPDPKKDPDDKEKK